MWQEKRNVAGVKEGCCGTGPPERKKKHQTHYCIVLRSSAFFEGRGGGIFIIIVNWIYSDQIILC